MEMEQMQVRYAGWRLWCSVWNPCKTKMTKCIGFDFDKAKRLLSIKHLKNKARNCVQSKTAHLRPSATKHVNERRSHRWVVIKACHSLPDHACNSVTSALKQYTLSSQMLQIKHITKYLRKDASMLSWQFYCCGSKE